MLVLRNPKLKEKKTYKMTFGINLTWAANQVCLRKNKYNIKWPRATYGWSSVMWPQQPSPFSHLFFIVLQFCTLRVKKGHAAWLGVTLLKTELFPFTAFWNDLEVFKPETVVATKVACLPPGTQVQPTRKRSRCAKFEHVCCWWGTCIRWQLGLPRGLAYMSWGQSLFMPQQHGKHRLISKSLAICMSPLLLFSHSWG